MEFRGEKAFLREIGEADLETVLRWRNSPRVHRVMFSDHKIKPDEHRRWFEGLRGDPDRKFFIIRDATSRKPVGVINWKIDRSKSSCEIGIYLGEEAFQGKGHAGEAMELAAAHLFEKEKMNEIVTRVFAFNTQAVRFYEKHGFQHGFQHGFRADDSLTWRCEKEGKPEDVVVMKRLRG
ncbi:MAG: UDP-4-amino-4,6-dideoxy-N-acetyl-beta-L-altrosamine N-acetyltransferase [bacterium]